MLNGATNRVQNFTLDGAPGRVANIQIVNLAPYNTVVSTYDYTYDNGQLT
jgi:hypothetical protein